MLKCLCFSVNSPSPDFSKPKLFSSVFFMAVADSTGTHQRKKSVKVICGTKNKMFGTENIIFGTTNNISGNENTIFGTENKISGTEHIIIGTANIMFGTENSIFGIENMIFGTKTSLLLLTMVMVSYQG